MKTLWMLCALGLVAAPAWADGVVCKRSTCKATWLAPQTNVDGSNLTDLAGYQVFVGPTAAAVQTMTTPTDTVPAAKADPDPSTLVTYTGVRTLAPGQYYLQVNAFDTTMNLSARTAPVPFVLQDDVAPAAVSPAPTISD